MTRCISGLILVTILLCGVFQETHAGNPFVRADADGSGGVSGLIDSLTILSYLVGEPVVDCLDAADVNDDGAVDIVDPVHLLHFVFLGGSAPEAPFPSCGSDPVPDGLDCAVYNNCP